MTTLVDSQVIAEQAVEQLGDLEVTKKDAPTEESALLILEKEHLTATNTIFQLIKRSREFGQLSANDLIKLLMYALSFPLELKLLDSRYVLTDKNTSEDMKLLLKWIVHLRDITFNYTMHNAMKQVQQQLQDEGVKNEQEQQLAE